MLYTHLIPDIWLHVLKIMTAGSNPEIRVYVHPVPELRLYVHPVPISFSETTNE